MKLENQVVSLELAKKLKELGVKQDSLFYWHELLDATAWANGLRHESVELRQDPEEHGDYDVSYAAFTVAELGEMLPEKVTSWKWQRGDYWSCEAFAYDETRRYALSAPGTEADARAKMLIYLLENKLIEV